MDLEAVEERLLAGVGLIEWGEVAREIRREPESPKDWRRGRGTMWEFVGRIRYIIEFQACGEG